MDDSAIFVFVVVGGISLVFMAIQSIRRKREAPLGFETGSYVFFPSPHQSLSRRGGRRRIGHAQDGSNS